MNKILLIFIIILVVTMIVLVLKPLNFKELVNVNVPGIKKRDILQPLYNRFSNRFKTEKGGLLPGVDAVYVITMPQRRKYISQQIKKLGFQATYFNAIKPSDLSDCDYNTLSTINIPGSEIFHKYTRLAVLLSFIMCFMDSLVKGYNTILLFEDDISITVSPKLLADSIFEFNNVGKFDIFYMGYCYLNCNQPVIEHKHLRELTNQDLLCCHSMAIKTRVLPGLIDYCFPMKNNSDEMFRDYYMRNRLRVCVPKTVYFTQNRESNGSLNESVDDPGLFQTCKF